MNERKDNREKQIKPEFNPPRIESEEILVQQALGSCAPPGEQTAETCPVTP